MRALLVPLRLKAIPAIDHFESTYSGGACGGGTFSDKSDKSDRSDESDAALDGCQLWWLAVVASGGPSDSSGLSDLSDLSD